MSNRWKVGAKHPGQMTAAERTEEIASIHQDYKEVLATPLMSDGSISPAQLGSMSQAELKKYRSNGQLCMFIRDRLRDLAKPESELLAELAEAAAAAERYQLAQRRARYETLKPLAPSFDGVKGKKALRAEYLQLQQEFDNV